ncbi:MAG TPA: Rieske 2Fe-2S domain-containing protein [Polyangiaceae bacterium]|nr:Rieske 2Fe-2S domain-containing protein [Polyangiaceae bacterium]
MTFGKAATLDELWIGEKLGVVVAGRPVLLVNVEGTICAYEDRCRHKGIALSLGKLEGHVLTCSVHGWIYDARTGAGINPASARLPRFPVRVEGDDILVEVAEVDGHGKGA